MLAQFIVMSVVVRLLFTLLHHSTSFTPSLYYHFSCPHLFYEKTILGLNKFIKILHKFYNCIRKGLFEVTVLNQVILTLQNYELLLYWKWSKEKQFANQTSFLIAQTLTGKLYFKEAMVSLFQLPTEVKDYSLFTGAQHFVESQHYRRKENITVDTYLNHYPNILPTDPTKFGHKQFIMTTNY